MKNNSNLLDFEKLVKNKFNVYNSLFLNLPYQSVNNIGLVIPLMYQYCNQKLKEGVSPIDILNNFFKTHLSIVSDKEKIDFMFRVIQYVERQVVLFDSVEDAAFLPMQKNDTDLSLTEYINFLKNKKNGSLILEKLSNFSTRIVFTAHPTQFYPPSVLEIIEKLRKLILTNDINEIDVTLQQLGLTSLINAKKPTPFEEAKNIIYFLQNIYYDAVGKLYKSLKNNFSENSFDNNNIIQLGFWPGGDRDGNPYVTAVVTNKVADELRMSLMQCYYIELKSLEKKLTFRKLDNYLIELKDKLYKSMYDSSHLVDFKEIINPLLLIKNILITDYNSLYLEELENFIDKVRIFKTHFAALDIRQNHSVHKNAVEQILLNEKIIQKKIEELTKEALISILLHDNFNIKSSEFNDELIKDTIDNMSQLSNIQRKNGEEGCNRYIISNSEDIFSVLFVYGLLRWSGFNTGIIPIDIIPLFETMEGMKNAESIMDELFLLPEYKNNINQRKETQTVMLGFSDGTKDGGYLKANWSILKTKENLSKIGNRHQVKLVFFDGRGGPPARGGGKTHRFYASQSENIANHAIQLTIQGQTITSRYGTEGQFIHNCEQLITAGLSHEEFQKENVISNKYAGLIENLSQLSFDKYSSLKNHEKFIPYLEQKSTLKYYSEANIGSRPSKRGNKEKLELEDLRAISFVGSWSQLKQNVPGYFGIGTAIKTMVDAGKTKELQLLFSEVPFFKALILNSMMSLSKCNFDLTNYIGKDLEFKEFWHILLDEYNLSKKMVLLISGYQELMEEELVSKSSIDIREQIVLPLLVIQQYALQMIEKKNEFNEFYKKIVKRSLYGNINASRNSA